MKPELIFTPLGGLGEIGMNLMVLECGNDAIIIDCGIMFPDNESYGVDLIVPDFSYLLKIKHKIRALILTHGHEDHIGAIPFLLRQIKPPIYGSSFTLALIKNKLEEYRLSRISFHEARLHKKLRLGCFQIEFLQVSHSIVDGMGLAIETPQGVVIHTADFKIDSDVYRGKRITLQKFQEYGKRGVLLLLSDSTNVEREGKSLTESQIQKELFKISQKANGRIIFSSFATNIRRIEHILEIALKLKRKVILSGRSMETNVGIARKLGFIHSNASRALMDIKEMRHYKPQELMVICTGSQAEEFSALWRMSQGQHKYIHIDEQDTIILSSKFIPGNEKAISRLLNNLYRRGAEAFYENVADVHVSGHAYADELRQMMRAVQPTFFIPIHGEYRHLVRHEKVAKEMGILKDNIFVCENGDRVSFQNNKAHRIDSIEVNPTFIDSERRGDIESSVLKDRRQLSQVGVVCVVVVWSRTKQTPLWGPEFLTRGVILEEENKHLLERAKKHLQNLLTDLTLSKQNLQEELKLQTRRFFKNEIGIKPIVLPIIIEL